MNRSVEQALTSLIPRYNGPLPPELVELAGSLLAQSRNKASNLKAEEEIGRTYACANLACERLKQSLNLPKIEPRPPCPPRIYSKLYNYFDSALVTNKRSRPSRSAVSTPTKAPPSRPTPTKATSLAPYKVTPNRAPSSRKRGLKVSASRDIPLWIQPVIREICRDLEAPAAPPHVIAGVTSILTLPSPQASEGGGEVDREDKKDKIPALVAAVFFFVMTRLVGKETNGKEYSERRKKVIHALTAAHASEELEAKLSQKAKGNDVWEEWEDIVPKDIDAWLLEMSSKGWLRSDWFENIVEGSGLEVTQNGTQIQPESEVPPEEDTEKEILQSGRGTMMQDRVDYLSEKKRAEYKIWKESIMARIEELEAESLVEEMDTGED